MTYLKQNTANLRMLHLSGITALTRKETSEKVVVVNELALKIRLESTFYKKYPLNFISDLAQ